MFMKSKHYLLTFKPFYSSVIKMLQFLKSIIYFSNTAISNLPFYYVIKPEL